MIYSRKDSRPKSFIPIGVDHPLRKKGDSNDAIDHRSIALLQTGYKVYTNIIDASATSIGDTYWASQQDFAHGRQMQKQ